ncbi:MAG TPA: hypothetical protein VN635_01065 [Conexibacter sp.]|nr:hypothetical protein [Conexibacter sp.]
MALGPRSSGAPSGQPADTEAARDGLATYLLTGDPSEQGQVFGAAGFIPELDPTGPTSGGDGPLTGMLVDGVNAFSGYEWENGATTGTTRIPFSSYTPFPLVTATQSTAPDGSPVVSEHDLISECSGADPMYYPPGGFTCQGLQDSGVALDVVTSVSPAGNVVDRLWRLGSTDGRAHQVALWMANDASFNALPRAWKGPGETSYAQRRSGDTLPPPAAGPWAAEFDSVGAADGDTSEGVGAIVMSTPPALLRRESSRRCRSRSPSRSPSDAVGSREAAGGGSRRPPAATLRRCALSPPGRSRQARSCSASRSRT